MFTRYAAGGWSTPSLALWMNTDPRIPKPRVRRGRDGRVISADQWTSAAVLYILRNPVYRGAIAYNVEPEGVYDRAAPGDAFTVEDKHPALVSPELWQALQERLDAARRRSYANVTQTPSGRRVALGSGLLRCAGCGGVMYLNRIADGEQVALYLCGRHLKGSSCTARGYKAELAHGALLAEVRRLRRAPWTAQGEQRLLGADGQRSAEAATLQRALSEERERLRRYVRRIADMAEDPTPEEMAAFNAVRAEIAGRIRALEGELAAASVPAVNVTRLRALHERLPRTEMVDLVDSLAAHGDTEGLRELVAGLIASATIVERRPQSHPIWLRAEVAWVPDVEHLLGAGLLQLAEPEPGPVVSTSAELHRARVRRYRQRQREQRLAAQAGTAKDGGAHLGIV
jgi:hypothetical protein